MPSRVRPPKRDPKPVRPPKPEPKPEPTPAPETEAVPGGGAVTMDTPFRDIGDVSVAAWRKVLGDAGSPLLPEAEEIVLAASPHGVLALVQAIKESSLGKATNARQTKNALGLMVPGSNPSRLVRFEQWADGFAEYSRRLSDPDYGAR